MSDNTSTIAQIPELRSFLEHYSALCESVPGRAQALEIVPAIHQDSAQRLLDQTGEALKLIEAARLPGFAGLTDLNGVLLRIQKEQVLDARECVSLCKLLLLTENLKNALSPASIRTMAPLLTKEGSLLGSFASIQKNISSKIDEDGSVRDNASPTLRSLRDQERRLHSEARERVESVLGQAFHDGFLQDRFFDFRGGRYLIPVKSEFRQKVPGLQVENSTSRSTIFVEPTQVRECNDKLKQVILDIEEEVYRILCEISATLYPHAQEFRLSYEILVKFDLTIARARIAQFFASFLGVSKPEFSDHFQLESFYHPLLPYVLPKEKVVRNNFVLGPSKRTLVISGPNTGGKTVLLKALAIFVSISRCGFYLPCAGEARLPFFTKVLCQIGDAQNIEENLSSFSGSLNQIRAILEETNEKTFIAIDEILHSTDPDEAAALSHSILLDFAKRGAYSVVTTHLNGLRSMGEPTIESASMEFDPQDSKPTYRLRLGIPGSSRALETAANLGFPEFLIDRAKQFLSQDKLQQQKSIDRMEQQERELDRRQSELAHIELDTKMRNEKTREREESVLAERARFKAETKELISRIKAEAARKVLLALEEFRQFSQSVTEKHQATELAKEKVEELKKTIAVEEENAVNEIPDAPVKTAEVEANAIPLERNCSVFVKSKNAHGVLLSDPARRGSHAEVQMGILKFRVTWDDLQRVAWKSTTSTIQKFSSIDAECPPSLDLRGQSYEEAEPLLLSFLDRASRSNRPSVSVVHGHGSGILKKLVRKTLQEAKYETKFRPGTAGEGGDGCTVIEFT